LRNSAKLNRFLHLASRSQSAALRKDAEARLQRAGYDNPGFLIQRYAKGQNTGNAALREIEMLYGQGNLARARANLLALLSGDDAPQSDADKSEALYLLGRIERDRK